MDALTEIISADHLAKLCVLGIILCLVGVALNWSSLVELRKKERRTRRDALIPKTPPKEEE